MVLCTESTEENALRHRPRVALMMTAHYFLSFLPPKHERTSVETVLHRPHYRTEHWLPLSIE